MQNEYNRIGSKSLFSLKLTLPARVFVRARARVHLENLRVMRRSRDALAFLDFAHRKRGFSANRYLRLVPPFSLRLLLGEDG